PEFFSGLIFTTAEVVFITAKIAFVLTSLFAVQIYDFPIFTVEYQGRKRNQEVNIVPCKKRKLSNEDSVEKETSKLDLIENRIRTRIKAHIRARLKVRQAEELRLLEIKALKENGWSKLIPHEILLRIFKQVVSDTGPVPFLCRMSRVCQSWKQVASETMLWREVNLSTMSIECPRSAIDSTIVKLAVSRLKTVRELNLDGWSELTDVGLKAIGKHCHSLQSIVLSQCGSLSSKGISTLVSKCRQLKMVDVAMTKIDIACLHRVTKRLGNQLEELCLMNCSRLGGEQVLPIIQERCPSLTVLDLTGTNIRKLNVEKLQAGCPKLKELFLANLLLHSTPISTDVEQNGFPQLETLCLACGCFAGVPRVDRFLFRLLRTSTNLKKLDVRGLQRITPEGLQSLPVTSLTELFFSDTHATFALMSAVIQQWHHSLEILDISSNSGVSDESMVLLKNSGMPKLYSLDLSSTNVTAEGVRKALNASPRLRHLNLTSCRGVPRGLKQWHGGAKIQSLLTTLEELESGANSEQRRSG
ncbi:hypothetical protein pdam_00004343, partial [Pocillopora damicornis]